MVSNIFHTPGAPVCRRCGQCCRNGGPALHRQDLELLERRVLLLTDLVVLRVGELAFDPEAGKLLPLDQEAVKIAPRAGEGWTCRKLDPQSNLCAIHGDRPAECRALSCDDPAELLAMYRQDRLSRADILGEDHPLLDLARTLDRDCPPARVRELAEDMRAGSGAGADELARMLRLDMELRRLAVEKGLDADLAPFILGRPRAEELRSLGFEVLDTPSGLRLREIPINISRSSR